MPYPWNLVGSFALGAGDDQSDVDFAVVTRGPLSSDELAGLRMLKFSFNAVDDGLMGQQVLVGEATRLAYGTDEAVERRGAFLEMRSPDWGPYPWQY